MVCQRKRSEKNSTRKPAKSFIYTELYGDLYFDPDLFPITSAVHPSTYLNKILLGSGRGQMQLWNIRTNKLIHSFAGWGGSAVLTLVQSPAVDVVGAGLEDGGVVLHNLRYDETLMKFRQDWGPVVGLAFRTGERGVNVGCVFESVPLIHLAPLYYMSVCI